MNIYIVVLKPTDGIESPGEGLQIFDTLYEAASYCYNKKEDDNFSAEIWKHHRSNAGSFTKEIVCYCYDVSEDEKSKSITIRKSMSITRISKIITCTCYYIDNKGTIPIILKFIYPDEINLCDISNIIGRFTDPYTREEKTITVVPYPWAFRNEKRLIFNCVLSTTDEITKTITFTGINPELEED